MAYTVPAMSNLTDQFARLPGIGRKTAARLAYYIINLPAKDKLLRNLPEYNGKQQMHHMLRRQAR